MASTTTVPPKCFRFFDLPQELRDMIYDMCTEDVTHVQLVKGNPLDVNDEGTISATISSAPRHSLLLANKQLSAKYLQQIKKSMGLVLEDSDSKGGIPDIIIRDTPVTGILARPRRVQLNLTAFCTKCKQGSNHDANICSIEDNLGAHLDWLTHFSAAGGVEGLSMRVIVVVWTATEDMYWTKEGRSQDSARLQGFTKECAVSQLDLRLSDYPFLPDKPASFEMVSQKLHTT